MIERFLDKVSPEPNSGCWIWTASQYSSGYGQFRVLVDGVWKLRGSHRVAYEFFKGTIPSGLSCLHRCDVKLCCNPEHLFLGNHSDNAKDLVAKGLHPNQRKLFCVKGHPFSGDNLKFSYGAKAYVRVCLQCRRARWHKYGKRRTSSN